MQFGKFKWLILIFILQFCIPTSALGLQADFYVRTLKSLEDYLSQDKLDVLLREFGELEAQPAFSRLSCHQQGTLLHKVGVAYYLLDREYEAIEKFSVVVDDLWQNCQVPAQERANTLYNIGICYQYTDEKYRAKSYIERSIKLLEGDSSIPKEVMAEKYHGAGAYFEDIKDYTQAQSYLQSALNMYDEGPSTAIELFDIINRLLILSLDFRHFDEVFSYFEKGLHLQSKYPTQIPQAELAQIYLNTGTACIDLENYQRSRSMASQGLNLLDPKENPNLYSNALELLGMSLKKEGQFQQAKPYYEKVLDLRMNPQADFRPSSLSRAIAFENISELYWAEGKIEEALASIDQAIFQLTPTLPRNQAGDPIVSGKYLNNLPDLIRQLMIKVKIQEYPKKLAHNSSYHDHSLSLIEKVDTLIGLSILDFTSDRSQLELLNLIANNYGQIISICLDLFELTDKSKYLQKAWQFSSRSKALILQRHLIESEALENLLNTSQAAKYNQLRANIGLITEDLQHASSISSAETLKRKAASAQLALEIFQDSLQILYPEFQKVRRTYLATPDLESLRDRISDNQVVIEFFLTADRVMSFWLTKEHFFHLDVVLNELSEKALSDVIRSQQDPEHPYAMEASSYIYQYLLDEGLKKLPIKIDRILLIPDGLLHSLSFDALQNANGHLILNYAISYAFSNSLIINQPSKNLHKKFIGYGTGYSKNLNSKLKEVNLIDDHLFLPKFNLAEQEIQMASEIFRGMARKGPKASLDHFIEHASDANIIHLSLHGLVDYENPNKSCILFDDHEMKYILSPQVLHQQRLQSDLVILSSCHSAEGKLYRGEGVSGMTRAFLYSGAKSVISSLWSATEQASLHTIESFLQKVNQGQSKDLALQSAKIAYLEKAPPSQKHPYYWANFILVGESSPISFRTSHLPLILTLSALSCLILFLFFRNK